MFIAHTGYLELFDLVVKHILPGMGLFFYFVLHFNCKFAGHKKRRPEGRLGTEYYTRCLKAISHGMPPVGVEPTLPNGNWILSPARLPIPPQRQDNKGGNRIRTGDEGFADLCLTTWLYHH